MRFLLPLLLAGAIAGCAPRPTVVPAPCPPPPVIPKPISRVDKLPPDAPLDVVARAYALDLAEALGYAAQLEAALDAYRKPAPAAPPATR